VPEEYWNRTDNVENRCLAGDISCFANRFRWSQRPTLSFLKPVQSGFESQWGKALVEGLYLGQAVKQEPFVYAACTRAGDRAAVAIS
jgi:hypothetical protein